MPMPQPHTRHADRHFTVADYLAWPDDERWELIDGVAHAMSPALSPDHQRIVGELYRQIADHLRAADRATDGACEALVAPLDVYLPEEDETLEESDTVLQPDVVVVCDPRQVTRRGIVGPPRWVIEVLSPSTSKRDQGDKRAVYERHGVRQYWLVHPQDRVVLIYSLGESGPPGEAEGADEGHGSYGKPDVAETAGRLDTGLLGGLVLDWDEVFARVTPPE